MVTFAPGDGELVVAEGAALFFRGATNQSTLTSLRSMLREPDRDDVASVIHRIGRSVLDSQLSDPNLDVVAVFRDGGGIRVFVAGRASLFVRTDDLDHDLDAASAATWIERRFECEQWVARLGPSEHSWSVERGHVPCGGFSMQSGESVAGDVISKSRHQTVTQPFSSDLDRASTVGIGSSGPASRAGARPDTPSVAVVVSAPIEGLPEVVEDLAPMADAVAAAVGVAVVAEQFDDPAGTAIPINRALDGDDDANLTVWPSAGRLGFLDVVPETEKVPEPAVNDRSTAMSPSMESSPAPAAEETLPWGEPVPAAPLDERPPTFRASTSEVVDPFPDTQSPNSTVHWSPNSTLFTKDIPDLLVDADSTVFGSTIDVFRPQVIRSVSPVAPGSKLATGILCTQGHFTDSSRPSCLFCGSPFDWSQGPRDGERPPLGHITLDDGRVFMVKGPLIIGRASPKSPNITGDETFVSLDGDFQVSRRHVEIRPEEWDVVAVDLQSANGASVTSADGRLVQLRANIPHVLDEGSIVTIGRHRLVFSRIGR